MLASLIFFLEVYHFLTHVLVLFGIRLLPRKDLVKQRVYFMIDLVCANISYWIHGRFWILIGLQNLQHLFYFFTWEQSWLAKRVVSWSSLDWDRGRFNQLDLVLGTLFDVMIHALNSVLLIQHLTSIEGLVLALILDALFVVLVLFNPKFAWATPNKVPNWVQKRVRALSEDERQAIQTFDEMEKLF